ncbi:MAG: DUF1460 domain-containing protein [Thermodesulfovibrionales bacterium]|nr:DUF1460 domain-containing protein [Thermodesulfovibrionales bacterium]
MAEKFVGTPYDPDPIGAYVRERSIIYDKEIDCMYLTFRAVELALSESEEEAINIALEKRFFTKGIIGPDGKVLNYEERYQYGEDMIDSRKFGDEITSELGITIKIPGTRGREEVIIIPGSEIKNIVSGLKSGDIVFFVKKPEKRISGEIIGHMGILKVEKNIVYLIHASGRKNGKGATVKIPFLDYVKNMDFLGIRVTRFKDP